MYINGNRVVKISFLALVTTFVLLSVGASQLFAPRAFSAIGLQKNASLPFLRAIVRLGDHYLIRKTFASSLLSHYPVVLDTYIREGEMIKRVEEIEKRAPESRDVIAAKIVLYEQMGDVQKAKEYLYKLEILDPSFVSHYSQE